jgi:hypothetical protein
MKVYLTIRESEDAKEMSLINSLVDWIAANARSFSYLLPDTLELALYLSLAAYFAVQIAQQQA